MAAHKEEEEEEDAAPHVVDFDSLPEEQVAEMALQLARQSNQTDGAWVTER